MRIIDAIKALERIKRQHGEDVNVFFDCPECHKSFTPNMAVAAATVAVHVGGKKPDDE